MNVDVVIPFFADAERIGPTVAAVMQQRLPNDIHMDLIVVDDGTPDDGASATILRDLYPQVRVLRLDENKGRSQACNAGVAAGHGEYVMILDNDCALQDENVLSAHLQRLQHCDVSIGAVVPMASGVWGELGNRVAARRSADAADGRTALLTTQHVVLSRVSFDEVGGFSAVYRQYGFEDRDLLGRLARAGFKLGYAADLVAVEHDDPDLPGYVRKARLAGKHSAAVFREDHPDLYAMTAYHRLDVGLHMWLRPLTAVAKPALPALIRIGNLAIYRTLLPMRLRVFIVRSLFGISFMVGTAEADSG